MISFIKNKKYSLFSFRIGVFLLASAPFVSSLLFLISLSFSIFKNGFQITKDKWNHLFIIASILMFIVSFIHFANYEYISFSLFKWPGGEEIETIIDTDPYSSFIGLANWIPLFFCFFGFQPYLLILQAVLILYL